jgi:GT2 family glycosyltransferase
MSSLTIVIITKNRPQSLKRCLLSISNSVVKPDLVAIYNNSEKEFLEAYTKIINAFATKLTIQQTISETEGIATMRNKTIALTSQEIIMSLDDDCEVERNAIAHVKTLFKENNKLGVLGAKIINIGFSGKDNYKGRGKLGINGRYETCIDQSQADFFGSATMSIRRSAYNKVGGYDEFFNVAMEEADLITNIKGAGYKVTYTSDVEIKHYNVRDSFSFSANFIEKEHCRLHYFFKHYKPKNAREWRQFCLNELTLTKQLLFPTATGNNSINQPNIKIDLNSLYTFFTKLTLSLTAKITFPFTYILK